MQTPSWGGPIYLANGIKYITADVFENVAIDYLYLQNNALTIYPIALSKIAPYEM
jgi:hypothetical protein